MTLEIGSKLGPYEIGGLLGAGGMGEVYRARDTRLGREVAVKVLPQEIARDRERRLRFDREARALSSLEHPHVCRLYDVGEHDGTPFLVMELLGGESLRYRLQRGSLEVPDALEIGAQLAEGLAAAHRREVVHRDLKPGNVQLTSDGAKILDFGLAGELLAARSSQGISTEAPTLEALTRAGQVFGTVGYLSPEQARGERSDARADLWALGCCLFEMLAGRRAFRGDSEAAVLGKILASDPDWSSLPDGVPESTRSMLESCLRQDPSERRQDAGQVAAILRSDLASLAATPRRSLTWVLSVAALLALLLGGAFAWSKVRDARIEREREVARSRLSELESLARRKSNFEAFALAQELEKTIPDDSGLTELWGHISSVGSVETEPPGATVSIRPYGDSNAPWRRLSTTPIRDLRSARDVHQWRFELDGFDTLTLAAPAPSELSEPPPFGRPLRVPLAPIGSVPPEMVQVPAGPTALPFSALMESRSTEVGEFLIDRHEASQSDYQEFLDSEAYWDESLWPLDLLKTAASARAAIASFVDSTGRPGPAAWRLGRFAAGGGSLPVTGISWFEAVAYCRSRGKELPTAYHWASAAFEPTVVFENMVPALLTNSNLGGDDLLAVGASEALGRWGATDLTGNVGEWAWNERGKGRLVLGGSWRNVPYQVTNPLSFPADQRPVDTGVRCMRWIGDAEPALQRKLFFEDVEYSDFEPVSDDAFAAYLRQTEYTESDLDAAVEEELEGEEWTRERVTFAAPYDRNHRIAAYVFLPRRSQPPFRTIVVIIGAEALIQRDTAAGAQYYVDHSQFIGSILRQGTAVVMPALYGMWESGPLPCPEWWTCRTSVIEGANGVPSRDYERLDFYTDDVGWKRIQDLHRTVDYLVTRSDIDSDRLGFVGISWGGNKGGFVAGPKAERFKVAILLAARALDGDPRYPEFFTGNWAPRVTLPTLLVSGREDWTFPPDRAGPYMELLGSEHKEQLIVDGNHLDAINSLQSIAAVSDWLDRFLGPVGRD